MLDKYYPPVTDLVSFDELPEEIDFLSDVLGNTFKSLFSKVYYRNLQVHSSPNSASSSYYLELIIPKELRLEVPGTGLALLLNQDATNSGITVIPLSTQFELPILRYVKNFNVSSFSGLADHFFDLTFSIFSISEQELITYTILAFIDDPDPLEVFANNLRTQHSASIPQPLDTDSTVALQQVIDGITGISSTPRAHILTDYILGAQGTGDPIESFNLLFHLLINQTPTEYIKSLFKPKFSARISVIPAVEFPRKVLKPLDAQGIEVQNQSFTLVFDTGSGPLEMYFATGGGFGFTEGYGVSTHPNTPQAEIGNSGFKIGFNSAKLDLSKTTNIPEADAEGRPKDFTGVFIDEASITLPDYLSPNGGNSVITGENLLIGTGGLSGKLGLEFTQTAQTGDDPSITIPLGPSGLELDLHEFSMTFRQNAITESQVEGVLKLPWFKGSSGAAYELDILMHFEQDGDFHISAKPESNIPVLHKEGVFELYIDKFEVGREDDRFFIAVSGGLEFEDIGSGIGKFLSSAITVNNLIIWDDGEIEFKGGVNPLPKAVFLKLGPAKIAVTNIHIGEDERRKNNELWKYTYYGFDAALSLDPGGLDLRGDGIKLYVSKKVDGNGLPRDIFMRIQGINIDLYLPASADRDRATLIIKGYLRMKNDENGNKEYLGGIDFAMPQQGIAGSASMAYQPQVPRFLVDASLTLSSPLVLGTTGLGIYDFRGLFGKRYVPSKTKVGLDESARWWEFYKKSYNGGGPGLYPEKFEGKDGTTIGAGVGLATVGDAGYAFSSKLMAMFIPNGAFVIMGQAQFLNKRIGLDNPEDPPFFASLSISDKEIVASLSANMAIPSSGPLKGKIATLAGQAEAYFSFQDPDAWYLALGYPDNRIRATALGIFGMDFYLNLSAQGITVASNSHFGFKKRIGPFKVEVSASIAMGGHISFAPAQLGGYFAIHGSASIKFWKVRWGVSVGLGMSIEAPKPFIMAGYIKACKRILRKKRCVNISFKWTGSNDKQVHELLIIDHDNASRHGKATHMLTGEQFDMQYTMRHNQATLPDTDWADTFSSYIIPMDAYIEFELLRGVNPLGSANPINDKLKKLGGINLPAKFTTQAPAKQGKSTPVTHEFYLEDFEVYYLDPDNSGSWVSYDFYTAMAGAYEVNSAQTPLLQNMKQGFWQNEAPGLYKRLQLMARTPVQFLTKSRYSELGPEHVKIHIEDLFCPPDPKPEQCVQFATGQGPTDTFDKNTSYHYQGLDFTLSKGANIQSNSAGDSLFLDTGTSMCFYPDNMFEFSLEIDSPSTNSQLKFYTKSETGVTTPDGLPEIKETLKQTINIPANTRGTYSYDYDTHRTELSKVVLEVGNILAVGSGGPTSWNTPNQAQMNAWQQLIEEFANEGLMDLSQISSNPDIKYIGLQGGAGTQGQAPYYVDSTGNYEGLFNDYFFNTDIYGSQGSNTAYFLCIANHGKWIHYVISDNYGAISQPWDTALHNTGYAVHIWGHGYDPSNSLIHPLTNLQRFHSISGTTNPLQFRGNNFGMYGYKIIGHDGHPNTDLNMWVFWPDDRTQLAEVTQTRVFQACYLEKEDYQFNQGLPPDDLNPLYDVKDQLSEPLSPVWRPNTSFMIKLVTRDYAHSGGNTNNSTRYHYYGFQTKGPIGHYHLYPDDTVIPDKERANPEYQALLNSSDNNLDAYRLDELTDYIDYANSFPDFKGNLAQAKPIYFENPTMYLRFKEPYMAPLYRNWGDLGGNNSVNSSLDFNIIDPALGQGVTAPHSTLVWKTKEAVRLPAHLQQMVNMLNASETGQCFNATLIAPMVKEPEIVINELKASKLYTVSVQATYDDGSNAELKREVYRFVLETSRFGSFAAHIQSLTLSSNGAGTVTKSNTNVLVLPEDLVLFGDFYSYIADNPTPALTQRFPDKTDLILQGILKRNDLVPDELVSSTLVCMKKGNDTFLLGVLIQSPEPLYDPRLEESDVLALIDLSIPNQITSSKIKKYISKDYSRIFIAQDNDGLAKLPATSTAQFNITEKSYDGTQFVNGANIDINILYNL